MPNARASQADARRIERLIRLFHYRWAAPILAELHRTGGTRFVVLANRLGIGRDSLSRTLTELAQIGLAIKNPGYGHPLRPEYILTSAGKRPAAWCARFLKRAARTGRTEVLLRKWSSAVLFAVGRHGGRFSVLRKQLPGITPRGLTLALKDLMGAGLLTRHVVDDFPPRSQYELSSAARRLVVLLGQV